jgi:hypothetical protein
MVEFDISAKWIYNYAATEQRKSVYYADKMVVCGTKYRITGEAFKELPTSAPFELNYDGTYFSHFDMNLGRVFLSKKKDNAGSYPTTLGPQLFGGPYGPFPFFAETMTISAAHSGQPI